MDAQITQDITFAVAVSTLLLSGFKQVWDATPLAARLGDGAYNVVLRTAGVILNLAFLCGQLASQGQLDLPHSWYIYLAAALGMQSVAHVAYSTVKAGALSIPGVPVPANAVPVNDAKTPDPIPPTPAPAPAPIETSAPVSAPAA